MPGHCKKKNEIIYVNQPFWKVRELRIVRHYHHLPKPKARCSSTARGLALGVPGLAALTVARRESKKLPEKTVPVEKAVLRCRLVPER